MKKADKRKLGFVEKMVLDEVREMTDCVENAAIRSGGIFANNHIDSIITHIQNTFLCSVGIKDAPTKEPSEI